MKKIQLTLAIVAFAYFITQGQNFSKTFNQVGKEEIELKQYAKDKNAEAVVLFDIAKSHFADSENSFDVVFERTTRIKILSEAGIKWAEVEIPIYQEGGIYETVYDVEAYTYNFENGKLNKTRFDISNIYVEKLNNFWNVKKFALPNVKEGSIIEYKYKINSQYKFNLRDWEFQWKIPVVYSEYEVKIIPFYEYSYLMQGSNKFDSKTSYVDNGIARRFATIDYHETVNSFVMKDVPAFKDEEFISSINDYIIKIDFQLAAINYPDGVKVDVMSTWEKMIRELLKHNDFGKYVNKSEKLASKLLNSKDLEGKTDKEKFDFIIEYVKQNYSWDKYNAKYASKSPKKLQEEKNGNCADLNLFAIGLLRKAGIETYPVLISTRNHGKIGYDYPYSHFFNYVLIMAEVDGEKLLSDATELLSLNNRIPSRCINDKGLIIKDEKTEWTGLQCLFASEVITEIESEFSKELEVSASLKKVSTEYDAFRYRNKFAADKEKLKDELVTKDFTIDDSSISVENQLDNDKPYVFSYKANGKPEIINGKVYFHPFLNETITDNPLKQKERTYPIDMIYPVKRTLNSKVSIPEGYQLDYLPKDQKIKNQLFELNYSVESKDSEVNIVFDYHFKKSVYSAANYSKIKFYFNEIVKRGNEKVVFSRIGEEGK